MSNNWLENNTFHHSAFWDLLQLIREKEKKDLTISLCIPTLNEENTIAKEIVIFRSELMERYPLIDEFAVIDSGSTDNTREVAANFGADVYLASDILPEVGDRKGKGENLWKAIYQLKGDIICYVDADIKNIHPRFVYGLVAPLIYNDRIKYVKAFYDRPLAFSQVTGHQTRRRRAPFFFGEVRSPGISTPSALVRLRRCSSHQILLPPTMLGVGTTRPCRIAW